MPLNSRRRSVIDSLIAASHRRTTLDCATLRLDAASLRTALVDRAADLGQFGLRISNARITGQLDLSACDVAVPIHFQDCHFTDPILLEGSDLHSFFIVGTPGGSSSTAPGILANGVRIRRDLVLSHTLITGVHQTISSISRSSAVWLTEGEIGGRLIAVGTTIDTTANRAIQADRCNVTGDVRLIHGFRANAEIRFIGAQLGGSLDLAGCQLLPADGRALDLAEATIGGGLFINDGPQRDPVIEGRLELGRTSINGRVFIRKATLKAPSAGVGRHHYNAKDPAQRLAIVAQGATIGGELTIDEHTTINGGTTLAGATIAGGIVLDATTIHNAGDIALDLSHARIGSKLSAAKAAIQGTLDLDGAEIAGPLDLGKAQISRPVGRYCLTAVRAVIHGDVLLRDARIGGVYPAKTPRESGGASFRGAELGGMLEAAGASVISPGDAALNLHHTQISGNLRLCGGFHAIGSVILNRVTIEGRMRCDDGRFAWRGREAGDSREGEQRERAAAVECISANIRGGIGLGWTIDEGVVDFTDTHTSFLADKPEQDWPAGRSYLTGFTYERYSAISLQDAGEWNWKARAHGSAIATQPPQASLAAHVQLASPPNPAIQARGNKRPEPSRATETRPAPKSYSWNTYAQSETDEPAASATA